MSKRTMERAQNKTLRVLMLIDALAHTRLPFTIQEARHKLEERSGSYCRVHDRTLQRDMDLLVSLNFAYVYRKGIRGTHGIGSVPTQYQMNLVMTSNVQRAAAKANMAKQAE